MVIQNRQCKGVIAKLRVLVLLCIAHNIQQLDQQQPKQQVAALVVIAITILESMKMDLHRQ